MKKIAAIGAGSWGTTLAILLARKGYPVSLWVREPELCAEMLKTRENTTFLPGFRMPPNLEVTNDMEQALAGAELVLSTVPSHGIRGVFKDVAARISEDAVIVSASKGIEQGSHLLCSDILREVLPSSLKDRVVILSGPSFAKEVSQELPAAVSVASRDRSLAALAQEVFSTPCFRVYTNTDPVGVELGGALKNVMALAAGASDGLGLGANARAALITRGLVEITRLGVSLGAEVSTFYGLAGMGDLVLTCTSTLSRNHTVGLKVGQGRTPQEVVAEMKMVAEGVKTSLAASELAAKRGVEMPITEQVRKVFHEGKPPKEAVMELMVRELKEEC
ncbi:Glycerol-3-phosphate dehydrogenase [NAD(P)+] [hydrothermal vent metagenome]|uniref:Glycerol-3-phosphate dehydrogenase [NAD(P)+] n=1 Tax=hydrothermal vent metagenome TaxID=652676 RepID=A0A3B0RKS7_9ZZZZ